jgi:hypothetical protein
MGTCDIYPGRPPKNILNFSVKTFFSKKSKTGHIGRTQNQILRTTTMTEFSKTFLVFYKWPNLTDVQVMLRGTVPVAYCGQGQGLPHRLQGVASERCAPDCHS